MRILRMGVLMLCVAALGSVPLLGLQAGQPAPQPAVQTTTTQQAYHLPPEKLAKAIALSRIRDIEHFVDAFWGLLVLWLLLATGAEPRGVLRISTSSKVPW